MSSNFERPNSSRITLRSDHAAGIFFIALGIFVFAVSGDLPFGTLSSPGAGMMPKLMAGLMVAFAAVTVAAGGASKRLGEIDWSDRWHALLVVLITAAAIFAYQRLGFLVTMSLLVFTLLIVIERRNVLIAAAYSITLTLFAYWLFGKALKAPLERGLLWF
jgi:Tripartite tricarboxylate transporter TctB family